MGTLNESKMGYDLKNRFESSTLAFTVDFRVSSTVPHHTGL